MCMPHIGGNSTEAVSAMGLAAINNLIKVILILVIAIGTMVVLGNIEFPSPNKEIEKFIPNEKLRTIK